MSMETSYSHICVCALMFKISVIYLTCRFYIGAYHALKWGYSNMDVLVALGTNAAYFYPVYIVLKALTSASLEGHDFFLKQVLCWYLSYCWEMFSWLKLLNLQELQCRIKLLRWFVFLFAPVIQYEVNTFDLTRLTRILLDAFFFICKAINWMCGILLSPFHSMHVHLHFQGIYWNIVSYLD
jgi:hypothetical protein